MEQIQVENVTKNFNGDGTVTHAVRNVNIVLNHQDFTAIVGASGSGKSTLLSLIGTLDQPTQGHIRFLRKLVVFFLSK